MTHSTLSPLHLLLLRRLQHLGPMTELTPPELQTATELAAFRDGNGVVHELVRLAHGGAIRNQDSALILTAHGRSVIAVCDQMGLHPEARPEIPEAQSWANRRPGLPGGEPRV
jgi:hypothetical protein